MKACLVVGTRPEIIKMSRLASMLAEDSDIELKVVYTGQHFSPDMRDVFLGRLGFPAIDYNHALKGESVQQQVNGMVQSISATLQKECPHIVLAEGDTNSVLAATLAAEKTGMCFGHVEAGLRSFDPSMPEEYNRIQADCRAQFNFAPTETAVQNLRNQPVKESTIHLTGNTIVEVTREQLKHSTSSDIIDRLRLDRENYCVLTLHRQESVDIKERFSAVLEAISGIDEPVVYPIHPRARKRLAEHGLERRASKNKNLLLVDPLGYWDFLALCANSRVLFTDSGGIQEEATVYHKPVIILRNNTERPEILGWCGWLCGYDADTIKQRYALISNDYTGIVAAIAARQCPFGDGTASQKILNHVKGLA